jgi:hypothetical protein
MRVRHSAGEGALNGVVGWLLNEAERDDLLRRFPPIYPDVVAHHVTLQANAPPNTPLPAATAGEIVGQADDGRGVQALVVRIEGTPARPDGSTYHVTWSLDRAQGRRPVESNQVIQNRGWSACGPVSIRLKPARF